METILFKDPGNLKGNTTVIRSAFKRLLVGTKWSIIPLYIPLLSNSQWNIELLLPSVLVKKTFISSPRLGCLNCNPFKSPFKHLNWVLTSNLENYFASLGTFHCCVPNAFFMCLAVNVPILTYKFTQAAVNILAYAIFFPGYCQINQLERATGYFQHLVCFYPMLAVNILFLFTYFHFASVPAYRKKNVALKILISNKKEGCYKDQWKYYITIFENLFSSQRYWTVSKMKENLI